MKALWAVSSADFPKSEVPFIFSARAAHPFIWVSVSCLYAREIVAREFRLALWLCEQTLLGKGRTESIVPPEVLRAVTLPAVPEKSLNAIDGRAFIVRSEFLKANIISGQVFEIEMVLCAL